VRDGLFLRLPYGAPLPRSLSLPALAKNMPPAYFFNASRPSEGGPGEEREALAKDGSLYISESWYGEPFIEDCEPVEQSRPGIMRGKCLRERKPVCDRRAGMEPRPYRDGARQGDGALRCVFSHQRSCQSSILRLCQGFPLWGELAAVKVKAFTLQTERAISHKLSALSFRHFVTPLPKGEALAKDGSLC